MLVSTSRLLLIAFNLVYIFGISTSFEFRREHLSRQMNVRNVFDDSSLLSEANKDRHVNSRVASIESLPSWSEIVKRANEVAIRNGFYGAIAGSVQVVTLMWLRTIVNYQYRYGTSVSEAIEALYNDGGIARFYRGMPLALIQNPLLKFGAVAANEGSKVLVTYADGALRSSPFVISCLGTLFSILWKLFLVPIETVKTVLQVDGTKGFQKLMQEVFEGNIFRLYSGAIASVVSTLLSHYPWFYVHNLLEQSINPTNHPVGIIARSAFIGFVASVVSDCVSNFVRVIKTLKQTLGEDNDTFLTVFDHICQDTGIVSLASRGLPLRIFANGLQSFVFVVVWKLIPLYLRKRNRQRETSEPVHSGSA